ncbi:hypothetical protein CEK71_19825 [Methylovulum psychrotolerans]|uniref:DUF883 domain-containing protein n=2 Tax=Methylovulum psychrotolerans TaxID=1704499 RepID=A0A1Z4C3M4_9GAMM|nr:hypothetical protein CEK71_19825 [Methylovulum psychrotolerans]
MIMDTLDKASHHAHDTFDKIAHAADQTAELLGEKSEDLLDAERQLMRKTRHVVRKNPIATMGIAATAGFLLSHLLIRCR